MNQEITKYRVTRKLSPAQPGAIKLARRYGQQLVCVRHRLDPTGNTRFTTVELVVEQAPMGVKPDQMVGVQIGYREGHLQSLVRVAGATWDREARLWRMPLKVARLLQLRERVVQK